MQQAWQRNIAFLLVISSVAKGTPGDTSDDAWNVMTAAIESGGPRALDALSLLGTIADEKARALLNKTFSGHNSFAIESAASGLPSNLCAQYLPKLKQVADRSGRETQLFLVLKAIRRAGSPEAARSIGEIAERSVEPTPEVAFGILQQWGWDAEPVLAKEAISGTTPRVRNTAIYILRDMRTSDSVQAFRSALRDPDEGVRLAAALALAQLGLDDGKGQLEAAAGSKNLNDQVEPLVALALLGQSSAFERLRLLLSRRSSGSTLKLKIVWALARLGDVKIKRFVYQMRLQKEALYQSMIIDRLLNTNNPEDLATIRGALAKRDSITRLIAAKRLLETEYRQAAEAVIADGLESNEGSARALAIQLAANERELWPKLADKLGALNSDSTITIAALLAIMKLNLKSRFTEVARYFASQNRDVALTAAKVLVVLDRSAAEPVFRKQIGSEIELTRIFSAGMLLALSNKVAGDPALVLPQITD